MSFDTTDQFDTEELDRDWDSLTPAQRSLLLYMYYHRNENMPYSYGTGGDWNILTDRGFLDLVESRGGKVYRANTYTITLVNRRFKRLGMRNDRRNQSGGRKRQSNHGTDSSRS